MKRPIKNNVSWIGKIDWELRKFHGDEYSTHRGSTYNSYLIEEEMVAVIDTVWAPFAQTGDEPLPLWRQKVIQNLARRVGVLIAAWLNFCFRSCASRLLAHCLLFHADWRLLCATHYPLKHTYFPRILDFHKIRC